MSVGTINSSLESYNEPWVLLELGGREEPLSNSLGKKHSLYTRIQPLFSSLFSLYSAARRVLPEIGPCNPNRYVADAPFPTFSYVIPIELT